MDVDIAIVGSGFSGIGLAVRLRREGIEDFVVLERGDGVGGTWHSNTYPGCACDVPSHLYSFSFAPNPSWSGSFSPQAEIQAYLLRTAEDAGIRPHVRRPNSSESCRLVQGPIAQPRPFGQRHSPERKTRKVSRRRPKSRRQGHAYQ